MLFVIDSSVSDLFASGTESNTDVVALDYLALGVAEGNHRITGGRKQLLELATNQRLSDRTRKVFARAAGRVSQEGQLRHHLRGYGVVEACASNSPTSINAQTQRLIMFPLRWFDSTAKIQPTIVLGENLVDAHIFGMIGKVGTVLEGLPRLPIKFIPDHGGGSGISDVLEHHIITNKLCVCIVDSDASCPGGTFGGTARRVQQFKNHNTYPLISVDELNGRDLENILPDSFYQAAYGSQPQHIELTTLMRKLTQAREVELRQFLDVEKGITLRQILNHPVGTPENSFWVSKLPLLLSQYATTGTTLPCFSIGLCSQPVGTPCTCVVVPGNTTNILTRFYGQYSSTKRYELASWLDDSVRPEWKRLGGNIASWCVGDDVLRL